METKITRITQLRGHEIHIGGRWVAVYSVTGPRRSTLGARGTFYHVVLAEGYTDGSGRIYPNWLNVWRGDVLTTRKPATKG